MLVFGGSMWFLKRLLRVSLAQWVLVGLAYVGAGEGFGVSLSLSPLGEGKTTFFEILGPPLAEKGGFTRRSRWASIV